jgi:hypothetical protein
VPSVTQFSGACTGLQVAATFAPTDLRGAGDTAAVATTTGAGDVRAGVERVPAATGAGNAGAVGARAGPSPGPGGYLMPTLFAGDAVPFRILPADVGPP